MTNQVTNTHKQLHTTTGCINKNNPLGKIHYLSYSKRLFHQIYSFYRGGFAPHTQQISSQYMYLLWFKNYNHLNLKVQFFLSEPVIKLQF